MKQVARDKDRQVHRLGHQREGIDVLVARASSLHGALLRTRPLSTAAPTSILVKTGVHARTNAKREGSSEFSVGVSRPLDPLPFS